MLETGKRLRGLPVIEGVSSAVVLTEGLIKSKGVCIAYETVTDDNGRLPLLAPMSAVAVQ